MELQLTRKQLVVLEELVKLKSHTEDSPWGTMLHAEISAAGCKGSITWDFEDDRISICIAEAEEESYA